MEGGAKIDPTSLEIKKIEISVQEAILLKKILLFYLHNLTKMYVSASKNRHGTKLFF
jgi:hypothetical protein